MPGLSFFWAFLLLFTALIYGRFLYLIGLGIWRLRTEHGAERAMEVIPALSIVIAARNESQYLGRTLDSLLAQDYPADRVEIIVVDDRSEDDTAAIAESYSQRNPRVKLIRQTSVEPNASPKKQALEAAIAASSGEIIVTTDADCTHPSEWLRSLMSAFAPETGMVAGQARFELPRRAPLWQRLQALDFQSQNVAAAGLIAAGSPFNCTGASLAFRRAAYDAVGGWGGVRHLISGDDELLMQKMNNANWKIIAAIGPAVVVRTRPPATIKELWQQRIRWGSKTRVYGLFQRMYLSGAFLFLFLLTLAPLVVAFGHDPRRIAAIWLGAAVLKATAELTLLKWGGWLFQDRMAFGEFLLAEIIHPLAIVMFAIGGAFGTFEWKGRRYHSGKAA